MRRLPRLLGLLFVLGALLDARTPAGGARVPDPPVFPELGARARVVTDRWGIPHVQAASLGDLYFVWGWVTARDRLWQLVESRAAAQGRLHRWFGNDELQADGGAQLFRLRERADAIWARDARDPALRLEVERYSAGINAYLRACRSGRAPWPPELRALRERPADWRPADSVLLLLGLGVTLDLVVPELSEAKQLSEHGPAWFARRHRFEGRLIFDTVPLPARGTAQERALAPAAGAPLPAATAAAAAHVAAAWPERADDGGDRASNAFVVGARRSASGRALLANDPHLGLRAPGPFHVVHLSVPGVCEAAGASIPGLPAIVSGRNPRCAWGVTALGADVIDVWADTLSADGRRVKGPWGWAPVVSRPFELSFRWLGLELPALGQVRRYTPHGPVLVWDPKHHVALAARWSALEDARITLGSMVGIERSRTAPEIAARFRTLVTPTINLMAADVDGNALYQAVGLVPARASDPPPGVLPGDGHHEWRGWIPADSMPAWRVPADGFAVNGNNRPAGPRTPYAWPGYDYPDDRAARMFQRLAGATKLTREDVASVQNDVFSRASARQLPALFGALGTRGAALPARARAALDTLRAWDGYAYRSRVAPTLARSWWNAYVTRSHFEGVPGLALAALTGEAQGELRSRSGRAETPAVAAESALVVALDTLAARLGPDLARWTWARAHRARFAHVLAMHGRERALEPPLTPVDGDGSTVSVGPTQAPFSLEVHHGPAFRHVVDLADSTTSWAVVPPWNSAAAAARGADLRERWATHAYVPLRLDWSRIAAEAAETLELRPR